MASTLLSRRLNPTTLLQSPNPFSQSLLLRSSPFLSPLSSFTPTTELPTSSPIRSRSDSIAAVLFSTRTPQRSHLSPLPSVSTAAVTSSSLPKPTDPHSKERRRLSSLSTSSADPKGAPKEKKPELRHQEITGPTVERDTSALANETRQVLESLRKSVYDASVVVAVLGGAHLALGAWIAYGEAGAPREVAVQALAASVFPLAAAFLMRRTLKPLGFFSKMEDMGRLQILTLALQSSKNLRTLLMRIRIAAIFCVLGVSAGSLTAVWMQ